MFGLHNLFTSMKITCKSNGKVRILVDRIIFLAMEFLTDKASVVSEMVYLTSRICWELVKKEGYIAVWRKPLNNSCYVRREAGAKPPLCRADDDPDDVW